jgi:hypothetical protein
LNTVFRNEHDVREELEMLDLPGYVWALVLAGALGIPAATGVALYRGALAAGLSRRTAGTVTTSAVAIWAAWLVGSGLLAAAGVYRQDPAAARPWIAVATGGALAATLLATRIPVVRQILAAPGTAARLAASQTLRVVGVVFLVVLALGQLPAVFALPAGVGDLAVGAAAPFVAYRLRRGRGRAGAVWFNVMGIVDLAVAVSLGFLAGLGPLRVLDTEPSTLAVTLLPLALIPTTAVPLAVALHVVSLRRLRSPAPAVLLPQPATVR